MPDTTVNYIPDSASNYDRIIDSIYSSTYQTIREQKQAENEERAEVMTAIFVPILLIVLYLSVRKFLKEEHYKLKTDNYSTPHEETNHLVYSGKSLHFSNTELTNILNKRFPYFYNLNPFLKEKFIQRLQIFIKKKVFVIHAKEGYKEMPVLFSAAAIQITFGLEKYSLPYFKYLQIHPEEYFAENSFRVLAGHVRGNSITIAFNQLLKGYLNPKDGSNVGLHEMAHALYFQEIEVNKTQQNNFDYLFEKVLEEGEDVYELKHHNTLFSNYAFKELQEFWAESVELFFERPVDVQNHYPELFDIMQQLLQQNPAFTSNPLLNFPN